MKALTSGSAGRIAGAAIAGVAAWLFLSTPGLASTTGAETVFRGQITSCVCSPKPQNAGAPCSAPCPDKRSSGKGTRFMLSDSSGNSVYQLNDQKMPAVFARQNVLVIGYLEHATNTIHVDDIVPELPARVRQAKTVAIVCDACPRAMSKVPRAALGALLDWNHFTLVDRPRDADIIFLFSANPYLGDYVSRDGPDRRPVAVDVTYLNLVDPHTGANLWGDYRQEGWLFISNSTRSLVTEVRQLLEMDQNPGVRHMFVEAHLTPRSPPTVDTSPGK